MKHLLYIIGLFVCIGIANAQPAPKSEKYKLPNGLEVIIMEFGDLPVTSVSLYVNTGKKNETPGLQYLSSLTADGLLLGNTKYNRIQQDNSFAELGTSVSSSANDNFSQVRTRFLNKDMEKGMDLLASLFLQPTFPEEEIKESIRQSLDFNNPAKMDIGALVQTYSRMQVFGTDNPLGRHFYEKQLNKITSAQVKEFYQFNYTPKNTKLVISGKPNKADLKKLIEKYFGPWKAEFGEVNGVAFDVPEIKNKDYSFVNKSNATQAALYWVKKAPLAGSKDVINFSIVNDAFSTILMDEIREKEGKTYGIYSTYQEIQNNGIFNTLTQVRSEVMLETTQSFDRIINDFYSKGINSEQLQKAKTAFKSSFESVETPEEYVSFFNPLLYPDMNKRYQSLKSIDNLNIEAANKIIKKYFIPGSYRLFIAGDEIVLKEQLSKLPSFNRLSLTSMEVDE